MHVPSSSSVLDGESPIIGSVDEIDAIGSFLHGIAEDCASYARSVKSARDRLHDGSAESLAELAAKLDERLLPGAEKLERGVDAAVKGACAYAGDVERIHRSARRARREIESHLGTIRSASASLEDIEAQLRIRVLESWDRVPPAKMPPPVLGPMPEGMDHSQRRAVEQLLVQSCSDRWAFAVVRWKLALEGIDSEKAKWTALVAERRAAERRLSRSLRSTELGRLIAFSRGGGAAGMERVVSLGISGEFGGVEGLPGVRTSSPLLRELIGTRNGNRVWDDPPDAGQVAANWSRLDPADRRRLVETVPWVVGNLPGLPFSVRDAANRRMLEFYDANRGLLGDRGLVSLDELKRIIGQDETPRASIVALDLAGRVPRVAVGYGELDRADNLTWEVPGMESDADEALPVWDEASRNLFWEQQNLIGGSGFIDSSGVIAFLCYDTPDLADSAGRDGVLSPERAREGAVRLARELDGAWSTRNHGLGVAPGFHAPGAPRIDVVAHSYGTTTAANALTLTKAEVDSFTMAGSAGIDTGTVGSLDELHVVKRYTGRPNIFASHASGDGLAAIGLRYGARANPTPGISVRGADQYPGATGYSSDGYRASGGQEFKRTDGHSVIGERAEGQARHRALIGLGFEASEGHGYWDTGTQSLRNIAASSLGLDNEIAGGIFAMEK